MTAVDLLEEPLVVLGRIRLEAGGQPVRQRARAQPPTVGENIRSAGPVDRAVDAAAAEQTRVRRVDDRVGGESGDVTSNHVEFHHRFTVRPRTAFSAPLVVTGLVG